MAAEVDLFTFLASRNIPDSTINQMKDDKIDISVIDVMTDEQLGQYIQRYGDRLALRAFCRQKNVANEKSGDKSTLMQSIRDRLSGFRKPPASNGGGSRGFRPGNTHAEKMTRRVEMGWLHFDKGDYHQVRARHGGGTRSMTVQKTVTMGELLEIGKGLFFPNGQSAKGTMDDFDFDIRDFSHNTVPAEITVGQLYEDTKLRMLRIYVSSQEKDNVSPEDVITLSETSSDFEATEDRPEKTKRMQTRSSRNKIKKNKSRKTDHQVDRPERSSNSDPAPSDLVQENERTGEPSCYSRTAPPEMSNTEVMVQESPLSDDVGNHTCQPLSNHDADQLSDPDSDAPLALAINASLEDFEIQFGPVTGLKGEDQDSTLPWNPQDLNIMQHSTLNDGAVWPTSLPASPDRAEKEVRYVKLRRVNVVNDILNVFMDPEVMNVNLNMELQNEKAVDGDGVSREVYSAFWEHFLEQCEGEDERVPRLRPDYSEKEWQAVGRVWLKGYLDHNIIPIRLSPAFILACCQGVTSVDEELLMMSFSKFLSASERASVETAIQGNMDETVEEDLLDLFSRMGSHCLPPKDNMQAAILTMAHKALLQEPKFIIDCFHSSIQLALPTPLTKDTIVELYESKRATNKKVAQMIKPSSESLNGQEQAALNHLRRYVRSTDQTKLEMFLRFCTGSTVLCKDRIEVTFNKLCGLSRRPVAHTCGAVLELPCTYSSYTEFRTEIDRLLSGDCFAMDIL